MRDRYDEVFKALADGHRRQILAALCSGSLVAGELARLVGLAPNAVSFHLKWLRSAGLVSVQREGRFLRYQANPGTVEAWRAHVRQTFEPREQGRRSERARPRTREPEPVFTAPPVEAPEDDSNMADSLPTELL